MNTTSTTNNMNNNDNENTNNNTNKVYFPFASNCLKGKFAVITGGGSGICFEIANQFVIAGCSGIIIVGRREIFLQNACQLLQQTAVDNSNNNIKIRYHICDVRNPEQCSSVMNFVREEFHNQLDILVNGAAGNFLCPAEALSPKGFATVLSIDAFGTYNICHAAYPLLSSVTRDSATGGSSIIINISATLHYGATWWQCHASAAKAAVDSLTRSLSLEWGNPATNTSSNNNCGQQQSRKRSIRVVGIAPGPIANTPGTTKLAPTVSSSDTTSDTTTEANSLQNMIQTKIPLGRMGYTYEIGHAAIYLCLANYITGHTIVVDGGEYMYRDPIVPYHQVVQLSKQVESKSRNQRPTTFTSGTSTDTTAALVPKSSL